MRPVGSTLTRPRSGEPGRAGRDEPAVERPQDLVDLAGGAGQPRHHLGGGEAQDRRDLGVVGERVDGRGVPAGLLQRRDQFAGAWPRRRRPRRGRRCRPRRGRAPAAGPAPSARRRTAGGPAGWPAPGRVRHSPVGFWPRMCSPSRIWTSLISHSQPSTCSSMSSNESSSGRSSRPEVVVHLGGPHQRPDLLADRGQLAGVERGDVGVLVEQLLQSRDVAVGFGARHRRDEVVDQHGVRAAFGLGALAGIVDQERVDQRQVAQRRVGAAGRRHAERLARQPLQVAVLAEVHDRVGAEAGVEPVVGGQVVVAGRQVGVVVDRDRVLAEPPRRLDHQHDVAGLHCGDDDLAVGVVAAVDEQLAGRRAPVLDDRVGEFCWQRGEPVAVVLGRHPDRVACQLPLGEPVGILAAALDQRVHQRVAVAGVDAGDRRRSR